MVTLSTHISANNCTPPSLPLVQLPTTDPSSPGINAHDYTPPSLPTMDPFNYEWRITYVIDGNMIRTFAKNMIAHFIPADGTRRTETVRSDLLSEFEVRFSLIAIALFYSYQCSFELCFFIFWTGILHSHWQLVWTVELADPREWHS
jgi:hypothetical protein